MSEEKEYRIAGKQVYDLKIIELNQPHALVKNDKPIFCPLTPPFIASDGKGMMKIKEPCNEACPFFEVVNEVDNHEKVYAKLTCLSGRGKLFRLQNN